MARNPIYPTSAGQTAVDRLLNQTLPRIIQDKQARDERAQQRQDTLDARKQAQDNYEKNYDYTIKRDLKNDQIRKEDKIIKLLAQASSSSNAGNLEDSMMYMNQAKFISQKDGTDLEGFGYSAQLKTLNKKIETKEIFDTSFDVFNDASSTKDGVTLASTNILNNWSFLTDSQKSEYRFQIKENADNAQYVGIQMSDNELAFFEKNSKLYSQTLGKKSGFDNLTEAQKDTIISQLPAKQQFLSPNATDKQKLDRQKNIDDIYRASGLFVAEKDLAEKYVTDTVNQYGSWESLSQEINGMSQFNRDLHIERLGFGLIKSGEAKDDREVESYLLEKGVSQETLDSSEMFKEPDKKNPPLKFKMDQTTLDVTRGRQIERTMGENGTASSDDIKEYRALLSKYKIKGFETIGEKYKSEDERDKVLKISSKLSKKTPKNQGGLNKEEQFEYDKNEINTYYDSAIKKENDIIDSTQSRDLSAVEKRKISQASQLKINILNTEKKVQLAKLQGNNKALTEAMNTLEKKKKELDKYSRGEGGLFSSPTIIPDLESLIKQNELEEQLKRNKVLPSGSAARIRGEQGASGKGAGTIITSLGQPIQK